MRRYYSNQVDGQQILSVESKTTPKLSPGFVRASKKTHDNFIGALPVAQPEPTLEGRIALLECRVKEILGIAHA